MLKEIRIYCEGGGDGKETKAAVRQGFQAFLRELRELARSKRAGWSVVACGGRNAAYENYCTALRTHPDAFNILLVDAEGPVDCPPWQHLDGRESTWELSANDDAHYHLMVQTMEAWFIADIDALRTYYGQGFNANAIPRNPDVEKIPKTDLKSCLMEATRNTQKGAYHKTRHVPVLLETIDTDKVRKASRHCARLFAGITTLMTA
jgi:hypothetical protein